VRNARDQRERQAPAEHAAEHGRRGHADEVGDGESEEQPADRRRPARLRGEVGGDQRRDAEERPVRESAQEPGREQGAEAGRERGKTVADGEQDHEGQQQRAARPARPRRGEQRGADDDPRPRRP
jgi:hypothetical protein